MLLNEHSDSRIEEFISWCVLPKSEGGAGLLEVTARAYVSALRSNPLKLTFDFPVDTDIFKCNTTKDIGNLIKAFKSAQEYSQINERLHNQFSAALEQYQKFIKHCEDNSIQKVDLPAKSNMDLLIERFAEIEVLINETLSEQKKIAHDSIDMPDWEQGQEVLKAAHIKISKLNVWKKKLSEFKDEILLTDIISKEKTTKINILKNAVQQSDINADLSIIETPRQIADVLLQSEPKIDKTEIAVSAQDEDEKPQYENDIKTGEYIRSKMRVLSSNGFTFTDLQFAQICSKEWSLKTLGLTKVAFAKQYIPDIPLSEQIIESNGFNSYWEEKFEFKERTLLFNSQWYTKDKDAFEIWYNSLNTVQVEHDDVTANDVTLDGITGLAERKKPKKIQLFEKIYTVEHWNEIITIVCEDIINRISNVSDILCKDAKLNTSVRTNFSFNESDLPQGGSRKKLSNNLFVSTNFSSTETMAFCVKILTVCDFSPNSLKLLETESIYSRAYKRKDIRETHYTSDVSDSEYRWQGIGDVVKDLYGLEHRQSNYEDESMGDNLLQLPDLPESPKINEFEETAPINSTDVIRPQKLILPCKSAVQSQEFAVDSWSSVLTKTCEHMILISPYKMVLADIVSVDERIWFTYSESDKNKMNNPKRLSNGLFVEAGVESDNIYGIISLLIQHCGYSTNIMKVI